MVAKDSDKRHLDALLLVDSGLKCRRLGDLQPHVEANEHQQRTGQEGHAPAPGEELLFTEHRRQHHEHQRGQDEADGRAQLREHAIPGLFARRRILGGQQHRTTPLASQANALPEAAQRQQCRRQNTDAGIGGQQADGDSGQAHRQQCRHQSGLAADAVAVVAEQRRAQGPCEEGQRESGQGLQRGGGRVVPGEEQHRKHQHGGGAVDVEIEELDSGADQAGEEDAPGAVAGLGWV